MFRISFSLGHASDATDIPQSVIRQAISRGELPVSIVGRRKVIRREALDAWLARYERRLPEAGS